MKLKVKVDPQLCIGAGSCVLEDQDHFELNQEGKSMVKVNIKARAYESEIEVNEKGKEKLLNAAQTCPTQAISIFDESGNQIFP